MGYLIEAPTTLGPQIVTAKISLTAFELLSPGYIIDIPEYPAIKNYYWQVLSMNGEINGGTILYVGTSTVHIQASTATHPQFRFGGGFMQNNNNTWLFSNIITTGANQFQFVENDNLQIHNPGTLTLGDGTLNLYITAILIPL
jgi:hypothetical protein